RERHAPARQVVNNRIDHRCDKRLLHGNAFTGDLQFLASPLNGRPRISTHAVGAKTRPALGQRVSAIQKNSVDLIALALEKGGRYRACCSTSHSKEDLLRCGRGLSAWLGSHSRISLACFLIASQKAVGFQEHERRCVLRSTPHPPGSRARPGRFGWIPWL